MTNKKRTWNEISTNDEVLPSEDVSPDVSIVYMWPSIPESLDRWRHNGIKEWIQHYLG